VLLILNAGDAAEFSLPGGDWAQQLDTSAIDPAASATLCGTIQVDWQSVLVLTQGGPA
jgi:isoamylase